MSYFPLRLLRPTSKAEFFSNFVSAGDLCFDVGANTGSYTKRLLDLNAKVVAIEPQADCVNEIQSNYGNNCNLTIVQKALSEIEGEMEILIANVNTMSSLSPQWVAAVSESGRFINQRCSWNKKQFVKVTTLDRLIEQYGLPEFIKIDVEGYEYQVLRGLSQPVKALSFEFTPEYCDAATKCITHLSQLSDIRLNYTLGSIQELVLEKWADAQEMLDIVSKTLSKAGKVVYGDIYAIT
jgi:FkbM family methyltransferase